MEEDQEDNSQIEYNQKYEEVQVDFNSTTNTHDIKLELPNQNQEDDYSNRAGYEFQQAQLQMRKYRRKIKVLTILTIITSVLLLVFVIALGVVATEQKENKPPQLQNYSSLLSFNEQFKLFKTNFKKKYVDDLAESVRYSLFSSNLLYFDAMTTMYNINFGEGFSKFYDFSFEEFLFILGATSQYETTKEVILPSLSKFPESVDWRKNGIASSESIDSGSSCAVSHIFATVGAIEAAFSIQLNKTIILSVQQVLDCMNTTQKSRACIGGTVSDVLNFTLSNQLQLGQDNPYTYSQKTCQKNVTTAYKIKGFAQVPTKNLTQLKLAVVKQPVIAMIDASLLQGYKQGILDWNWCPLDARIGLNLAVLIVGYESDYFIVKNYWGPAWGENGYFKVRMSEGLGVCGINLDAKYPII